MCRLLTVKQPDSKELLPAASHLKAQRSAGRSPVFHTLDLLTAYAYIRIKQGDKWKTAFCMPYRHYKYQVMLFRLTNAPATFQSVVDYAICPFLDKFAVCYLNNILIFSKTLEEHKRHVRAVLDALYMHKLSVNKDKSKFYITKTVFLGYKILPGQIQIEPAKIEAIKT